MWLVRIKKDSYSLQTNAIKPLKTWKLENNRLYSLYKTIWCEKIKIQKNFIIFCKKCCYLQQTRVCVVVVFFELGIGWADCGRSRCWLAGFASWFIVWRENILDRKFDKIFSVLKKKSQLIQQCEVLKRHEKNMWFVSCFSTLTRVACHGSKVLVRLLVSLIKVLLLSEKTEIAVLYSVF